jgi:hypothetical protein
MSDADYRTLYDMRVSTGRLQATVQAAVRTAEQLKEQITDVKTALKTNTAPDSVSKQADAVDHEISDILKQLRGDPEAAPISDTREEDLDCGAGQRCRRNRQRLRQPTALQRATLTRIIGLQREVGRINALLRPNPALTRARCGKDSRTIGRPSNSRMSLLDARHQQRRVVGSNARLAENHFARLFQHLNGADTSSESLRSLKPAGEEL